MSRRVNVRAVGSITGGSTQPASDRLRDSHSNKSPTKLPGNVQLLSLSRFWFLFSTAALRAEAILLPADAPNSVAQNWATVLLARNSSAAIQQKQLAIAYG